MKKLRWFPRDWCCYGVVGEQAVASRYYACVRVFFIATLYIIDAKVVKRAGINKLFLLFLHVFKIRIKWLICSEWLLFDGEFGKVVVMFAVGTLLAVEAALVGIH